MAVNNDTLSPSQGASETASRLLKQYGALKSVHVVPVELIDRKEWEHSPNFGRSFGRAAAPFAMRDLANSIQLRSFNPEKRDSQPNSRAFRLGIAGGSTVYGVAEQFRLPDGVDTESVEVVPLVMGPIPETAYSAGLIAGLVTQQLSGAKLISISSTTVEARKGITIQLRDEIVKQRELADTFVNSAPSAVGIQSHLCCDFIMTGVGAPGSEQFDAHMKIVHGQRPGNASAGIEGDLCSRWFNQSSTEVEIPKGDSFVAISFAWLIALSKQRSYRVVAIAGGRDKVYALYTLLSALPPYRLINALITDELTARCLLRFTKS